MVKGCSVGGKFPSTGDSKPGNCCSGMPGSIPVRLRSRLTTPWIDRKRRVVERYAESSYLVGERFRQRGTAFEESSRLDPDRFAAHGGSFPLRLSPDGPVLGAITVSGLPSAEDHRLIVEALERYLGAGSA